MVLNVTPSYFHATLSYYCVIGEVDQREFHCCRLHVFCGMRRKSYPIQNHRWKLDWIMTCIRCLSSWWIIYLFWSVLRDFAICLYLRLVIYNWKYIWHFHVLSNQFCVRRLEVLVWISVVTEGWRDMMVQRLRLVLWCNQLLRHLTWWVCRLYLFPGTKHWILGCLLHFRCKEGIL